MRYFFTNLALSLITSQMERETGIGLSRERVRQILLKNRMCFNGSKLHVVSDDPLHVQKRKRLERFLAALPKRTVALFEDKTELHLNPCIRKTWQDGGSPTGVDAAA